MPAPLETTPPAVEETQAPDVATPKPVETAAEAEMDPETGPPLVTDSEITELDETWNQFIDHQRGFSIDFPKEMATTRGDCTWNEEQGSFRPETALVPVQIFEDADAVYIAAEHYFELAGKRTEDGRSYFDECNLVTNSLELLQDPDAYKEPYWQLVVVDVQNDGELDSFIKERYGPGCSVGEQTPSTQDGVYDVSIQGDGKSLEETQCPINYVTVVKYFPAGGKLVAWDRGQANYFPADVNYAVTYDQEMEDSFRFLTEPSDELLSYTNPEYGFTLRYPPTWTIAEVNDEEFVGPGSHSVQLSQGTIKLIIGYRRAGEEMAISASGMPAGEFELRGTTEMLGQAVERYVLVYEGKDKAVIFGPPGSSPLALGDLEFSSQLLDFNPDYNAIDLTQTVKDEANIILGSLASVGAEG
jgi:hypothetical protein